MKRVFQFFLFLVATALIALFLLTRVEVKLPESIVEHLSDAVSSSNWVCRIDSVHWRFPKKIRISGIRMFNREKADTNPFLSVNRVDVRISLSDRRLKPGRLIKSIAVDGVKMPRLPDGYYIPDSVEFPGQPDFLEKDSPVELELPEFRAFKLAMTNVDILDLRASRVTVGAVESARGVLALRDLRVDFPDRDVPMSLTGNAVLDIPGQRVAGDVHGQARQANIRPMLQALDIANSYQFVDAFTGVNLPVDAGCKFEVNLRNSDLRIFLDLHPTGGAYRGVPFETAQGNIDIRVFVREHFQNAFISVGPLIVRLPGAESLTGGVFYENTNDVGYVTFKDVQSVTSLSNALAIADILNDGTLDCLQPETPPVIKLDGLIAVDPAHSASNRLDGSVSFARGKFFGIPLVDAHSLFKLRGDQIDFLNATASLPRGGEIKGEGRIGFPGFREDRASFKVAIDGRGVALEDVAEIFGFDIEGRRGKVSGSLELSAPFSTNIVSRLDGKGSIRIANGHLARLNVFAGLTGYLAKRVPGISALVDQSNASMDFTIADGVLRTDRFLVSGDVFTISGAGSYSMTDDNLDFTMRVSLFRNDTILSRLTAPFAWTFSKLLLEFKVYGPLDNPQWDYVSVLEKLQ